MNLKQRIPFLRWSAWRLAVGARNVTTTGQIGDGREAAAADYVISNARQGDIDDVLAAVDRFAYEKSVLINVGDEKGALLDAAAAEPEELLTQLGTTHEGLDTQTAAQRLSTIGPNLVARERQQNIVWELIARAKNPLNFLLLSLATVSYFFGPRGPRRSSL